MRMRFIGFLIFSFFLSSNISAQETVITWEKDFKKAQQTALALGRPLLLDFTADWCKPCKVMDQEFWVRPDVVNAVKPFVAVKINYDNERSLASRYGAAAIPFVVFTDPLGNLVTSRRGFSSKNVRELNLIFDEMPKDFSAVLPSYEKLKANKNDGLVLLQIADWYRSSKLVRLSCDFYKKALKTSEVQGDAEKKDRIMATIGVNYFKIREYDQAVDELKEYLKNQPNGTNRSSVIFALTLSNIYRGKLKDAEKNLVQLKAEFPASESVAHAEREIENARNNKSKK